MTSAWRAAYGRDITSKTDQDSANMYLFSYSSLYKPMCMSCVATVCLTSAKQNERDIKVQDTVAPHRDYIFIV